MMPVTRQESGPQSLQSDEPVLDGAMLAEIRALDDDGDSFLKELFDIYVTDSTQMLTRIDQALKTVDAEGLYQAAHRMKSGSDNIGARQLSALCRSLERCGRNSDVAGAHLLVEQLKRAHAQFLALFTTQINVGP